VTLEEQVRLLQEQREVAGRIRALLDAAEAAKRDLTKREDAECRQLERRLDDLQAQLPPFDPRQVQGGGGSVAEAGSPVLAPEQRMTEWVRAQGRGAVEYDPADFSFARALRGMTSGRWNGADLERRVLAEGTAAAGGYLIPEPLSTELLDRVRNAARVFQAGARTVPMTVDQLSLARLVTGAAVGWKVENDPIVQSDMVFDRITLNTKTLPILVRLSRELYDDLTPEASDLILGEMASALALELDRVVLRGSGSSPEPRGIRNQTGVVIQSLGANGETVTWDNVIDAVSNVRNNNGDPNAILWASRTQQTLDKLKDSESRYIETPPPVRDVRRLISNQVPIGLTVGTSNDCSEIYTGDWKQVLVGIRTDIAIDAIRGNVQVLRERYADSLQVGLLTYIRVDVVMAHPELFNVTTGVRP
jgi:HK97 family phage major capsid protein